MRVRTYSVNRVLLCSVQQNTSIRKVKLCTSLNCLQTTKIRYVIDADHVRPVSAHCRCALNAAQV